jgi:hypothetical protein
MNRIVTAPGFMMQAYALCDPNCKTDNIPA